MASSKAQKRKRRTGDNRRSVTPVATVVDPHHDGIHEWGMTPDGCLYHRTVGGRTWERTHRVHATPKRILALARLVEVATGEGLSPLPEPKEP